MNPLVLIAYIFPRLWGDQTICGRYNCKDILLLVSKIGLQQKTRFISWYPVSEQNNRPLCLMGRHICQYCHPGEAPVDKKWRAEFMHMLRGQEEKKNV
jgi:hypothetical protein